MTALLFSLLHSQAQNPTHKIVLSVIDSLSNSPIPFFTAFQPHENVGGNADENGKINLVFSIASDYKIIISAVGYEKKTIQFTDAELRESMTVKLAPLILEEVIISSTRTNARIEDLPIKVEVLGQEEMDEESSIVPGGIGSLLGDLSVITVQKTNPVNEMMLSVCRA